MTVKHCPIDDHFYYDEVGDEPTIREQSDEYSYVPEKAGRSWEDPYNREVLVDTFIEIYGKSSKYKHERSSLDECNTKSYAEHHVREPKQLELKLS